MSSQDDRQTATQRVNSTRFQRQRGAWLGLAVGDALGAPYEFKGAATIASEAPPRLTMRSSRLWEAGEWTDDTDLTLAASAAYVGNEFLPQRAADAMVAWMRSGPKDVGNLTRLALGAIASGQASAETAGAWAMVCLEQAAGNGSLMRALPTGLRDTENLRHLAEESAALSRITHADPRCVQACVAFNFVIAHLIEGSSTQTAMEQAQREVDHPDVRAVVTRCLEGAPAIYPHGMNIGFVLLALQTGLVALRDSPSYEAGIEAVIRHGGDTDTNAAIAGALLGAKFGDVAIPADWLGALQNVSRLEAALHALCPR